MDEATLVHETDRRRRRRRRVCIGVGIGVVIVVVGQQAAQGGGQRARRRDVPRDTLHALRF